MYGIDIIQLAAIEQEITRMIAMKDACVRHNAPATAIAACDEKLRGYWREKQLIVSKGITPDQDRLERKAAMVEKILEALDPDQSENVSWWAI